MDGLKETTNLGDTQFQVSRIYVASSAVRAHVRNGTIMNILSPDPARSISASDALNHKRKHDLIGVSFTFIVIESDRGRSTTPVLRPNKPLKFVFDPPCCTHFETHIDPVAQITILTLQLEASVAYNARLNARLSTALDTLDILQAELDAERKKNEKNLWMNIVQELQREKDEMKEVVELLIRKGTRPRPSQLLQSTPVRTLNPVPVERSRGNFDRWQYATMHLPCPAGKLGHAIRAFRLNILRRTVY